MAGAATFAIAIAIQTLLYGAAQPFSGAIADRFGTVRVVIAGTVLYSLGIFMMGQASTPITFYLSSSVLIGFGLSGCSFDLHHLVVPSNFTATWRSTAFGAAPQRARFGQFLFSPLGVSLIKPSGGRCADDLLPRCCC